MYKYIIDARNIPLAAALLKHAGYTWPHNVNTQEYTEKMREPFNERATYCILIDLDTHKLSLDIPDRCYGLTELSTSQLLDFVSNHEEL